MNNNDNCGKNTAPLDITTLEDEMERITKRDLYISFGMASELGPPPRVGVTAGTFLKVHQLLSEASGKGPSKITLIDLEGDGTLLGRHFISFTANEQLHTAVSQVIASELNRRIR